MNRVPTVIPVTKTIPMLLRAAAPGPDAKTKGRCPKTVAAEVIGRQTSQSERVVTLDTGSDRGISVGDVVLADGGALVGRVVEVGPNFSRVLLVSDGFHMLRLKIIATRLGLAPFPSPAPTSPIRSNPRMNAGYMMAEGVKVPLTWLFHH